MLCTSVCPSEALVAKKVNFFSLLDKLRRFPKPVLSCYCQPDLQAHEKTECLGWLAEDYLAAFLVSMPHTLQLNLTACLDCQNGFIVDVLKKNLESAAAKTGIDPSEKITLVENRSELAYQEVSHDRRSFFRVLKKRVAQEVSEIIDREPAEIKNLAYGQKKLPLKREALNYALSGSCGKIRESILQNYYYHVVIKEQCDSCFACVAMCPTGALHIDEKHIGECLRFDSYLCNGCELCVEFCVKYAILIKKGWSQSSRIVKSSVDTNVLSKKHIQIAQEKQYIRFPQTSDKSFESE